MGKRRLCALLSLVLGAAALVIAIAVAVSRFPRGLSVLLCLVVAGAAIWYALRHRDALRIAGLAIGALLIVGAVVLIVVEGKVVLDLVVVACLLGALGAARTAFGLHVDLPAAPAPARAVLFYNPKSGGGKAERFHLADEARKRGIDPIELKLGDDLETLVRDAVSRGADGLAMAGGDGSQAIVAMVAAEVGLPYACIPAGTRNHFALDLGVIRDDVVGALDAFVNGGERLVDLAEVNGRVFVNNVSLGLYAEAVQKAGYREAKIRTILDTVPEVAGPDADPPRLTWDGPNGEGSGLALLVSNNHYRLGRALSSGTRPRLDRGELGIAVIGAGGSLLALEQWTDSTFEARSNEPVPAGIDGEALVLDPPLRFRSRPGALRVRIAPSHPGASPSAQLPDSLVGSLGALGRLALRGTLTPDNR
jgi:diacylglycerol kinase family enzyme